MFLQSLAFAESTLHKMPDVSEKKLSVGKSIEKKERVSISPLREVVKKNALKNNALSSDKLKSDDDSPTFTMADDSAESNEGEQKC